MPMIDIVVPAGRIADVHALATQAAITLKAIEGVPDIAMFRRNTACVVHEIPETHIANAEGDGNYVRVQVLTNAGALSREQQCAVVSQLTNLIADAAGGDALRDRIWVVLTEAVPGGWGLWGHAHTNDDLVAAARREISAGGR